MTVDDRASQGAVGLQEREWVSTVQFERRRSWSDRAIAIATSPIRFTKLLPGLTLQLSKYLVTDVAIRPTILAAIGVHVILLALPLWELTRPPVAEEESPPEDPTIEAVSLGDLLATSEPPPADAAPPSVEAAPAAAPAAAAPPVLTKVPETLPEALPETLPLDVPADPLVPEEDPAPAASQAFDPALQGQFTSSVNMRLGRTSGSDFDNTDQWPPLPAQIRRINAADLPYFFTAASIQEGSYQPQPGAGLKLIGRNIDLVIREDLPQTTAEAGFGLGGAETYGNHPLHAIVSAEGQPVAYVSLLDMKGSTVVITWPRDPRAGG